jgi:hypothetical protein
MNVPTPSPRFAERARVQAIALRLAVVAAVQVALIRAYYGTTNMYLKIQTGTNEDATPRLHVMHLHHLVLVDALVIGFALAHRSFPRARAAAGFAAPLVALVVAGWLNVDPPVGRAFIAALALAPLVAFAAWPLPPPPAKEAISSSSDEGAS